MIAKHTAMSAAFWLSLFSAPRLLGPMLSSLISDRRQRLEDLPKRSFADMESASVLTADRSGGSDSLASQVYTQAGQAVSFTLGRFDDGTLAFLSVMDDPSTAPPPAAARSFTGAVETRLGERCRVWSTQRTRGNPASVQTGCVTNDGVELWRRRDDGSAVFATKVSRKPVLPSEVRIPTEAFNLRAWTKVSDAVDHALGYEVVLQAVNARAARVVERRSGDWTATRNDAQSILNIVNTTKRLRLVYTQDRNGQRRLTISRQRSAQGPWGQASAVRQKGRPDEIVLGETCRWWDLMPGMEDAGRRECRTADGIALKAEEVTRRSASTSIAVSLRRVRQPLSAVMPDRAMISPSAWGLE